MTPTPASLRRLLSLLSVVAFAAPVAAQEPAENVIDQWSEPNPGLRHLRRTMDDPPVTVNALVVDLRAEGVRVVATPQPERWGTVADFARRQQAAAAINGGFWGMWQRPTGVTAGGGQLWEGSEPDPDFGHFGIRRDGRAVVHAPGEGEDPRSLSNLREAVSGRPLLVRGGEVATDVLEAFGASGHRQPRTAAGVSADGRTVILVVADGRQSHSRGLTLHQLASLLVELGAHRAINLDGGGSSTMYVARDGGVVNSPARGRWYRALGLSDGTETRRVRTRRGHREVFVRGVEREVMNHLAVLAPRPSRPVPLRGSDSVLADGLGSAAPPPRLSSFAPPADAPVRLGRLRELAIPALYVGAPVLLGLVVVGGVRRRWSR